MVARNLEAQETSRTVVVRACAPKTMFLIAETTNYYKTFGT